MKKRGMSAVVTTLLIILLTIVAIGIVWVVVKNVINKGSEEISLTGLTLDLEIVKASVEGDILSVTVKRNAGEGNLVGINFVFSDGDNSVVVRKDTNLAELGMETFTFDLNTLAVGDITSIEIAPIFETKNGKEATTSEPIDSATYSAGSVGSGDTSYTGSPGGDDEGDGEPCTPTTDCVTEDYECGTLDNGCSIITCGDCTAVYGEEFDCDTITHQCYNTSYCPPDYANIEEACAEVDCGEVSDGCGTIYDCTEYNGNCSSQHSGNPNWECVDNYCEEITYINSGVVMWSGPPNVNKLFSGSTLLNDTTYDYYFVTFPNLATPHCYVITDTKPGDDMYAYVILTILTDDEPLTSFDIAGQTYEVWESYPECSNSLS